MCATRWKGWKLWCRMSESNVLQLQSLRHISLKIDLLRDWIRSQWEAGPQSMSVNPAAGSRISDVLLREHLGHPPPQSWNPCCTQVATISVNVMSTKMKLFSHFNYGCSLLLLSSLVNVSCLLTPSVSAFWLGACLGFSLLFVLFC